MRPPRGFVLLIIFGLGLALAGEARAVSPRNPYRSFNLSGLNYGSMQWEKAQRQGKRAWPSSNTPVRTPSRGGSVVTGGFVGGGGGAIIQGGDFNRPTRGLFRRR